MVTILVFRCGGEEFALEISSVMEIRRPSEVIPLPGGAPFVEGVSHIRGRPLPIIDLAGRLLNKPGEKGKSERFIVAKIGELFVSLHVEKVLEVMEISLEETAKTPDFALKVNQEYVHQIVDIGGRVILLLNPETILSQEERLAWQKS